MIEMVKEKKKQKKGGPSTMHNAEMPFATWSKFPEMFKNFLENILSYSFLHGKIS